MSDAGYRLGCQLLVVLTVVLAACSPVLQSPDTDKDNDGFADDRESAFCALPWESMRQVRVCGSTDYNLAKREGDQTVHVVVRSKDARAIAAALAGAWSAEIAPNEEAVVFAYSKANVIGWGYDRGVLSEQGPIGTRLRLVFEICTEWGSFRGPGDLCSDKMEFTIEQE
jgi:hypothetical protein